MGGKPQTSPRCMTHTPGQHSALKFLVRNQARFCLRWCCRLCGQPLGGPDRDGLGGAHAPGRGRLPGPHRRHHGGATSEHKCHIWTPHLCYVNMALRHVGYVARTAAIMKVQFELLLSPLLVAHLNIFSSLPLLNLKMQARGSAISAVQAKSHSCCTACAQLASADMQRSGIRCLMYGLSCSSRMWSES